MAASRPEFAAASNLSILIRIALLRLLIHMISFLRRLITVARRIIAAISIMSCMLLIIPYKY